MRFMHIAGEATLGVTARERLRRQIDGLSRELATLEDLVAQETGDARAGMYRTSIQTGRASALRTQVTDKRVELEALIERERALGPEKVRETSPAAVPIERAKPGDRTGGRFRLRRGALLLALAPVAIIAIAILGLQVRDLVLARIGPIGSTGNLANEVVPAIKGPVDDPGDGFFSREIAVSYTGGRVFLSGPPYPGGFAMDDQIEITVARSDGSTSTWNRTFGDDCGADQPVPPQDVTQLFALGRNTVTVVLYDRCGEARGASGPVVLSTQR